MRLSGSLNRTEPVAVVVDVLRWIREAGSKKVRLALVVYGALIAVIACAGMAAHRPSLYLDVQRQQDLTTGLDVVRHGGPPLVGIETSSSGSVSYYPLAYNDDRGAYVYLPVVGRLAGSSTLAGLVKWSFLTLFAPIFAFYPLVFFEITSSIAVALIAPLAIWWKFAWFEDKGVYWIPGWCALFCLPLVLLVYKRWNRLSVPALAFLTMVGSFASSIRANSGWPVLLAAVVASFSRVRPWSHRLAILAVLLLASASISTIAMTAIQRQRDAAIHSKLSAGYPVGHPTWHSIYIGLGYLPNKYGIRYKDSSAFDYAQRVRPDAAQYSSAYEAVLRRRYFQILRNDPGFVARTYLVKAGVVVRQIFWRYWLLLPALLVLLIVPRRHELRTVLLILFLAAIGAAAPVVLTVPDPSFELGLLAVCAVGALASFGWLAALVEQRMRLELNAPRHLPKRVVAVGVGISATLAALSLNPATNNAQAVNFYRMSYSDLVGRATDAKVVQLWRAGNGGLMGWSRNLRMSASARQAKNEIVVKTDSSQFSYNLSSPTQVLPPGQYEMLVAGGVEKGGLMLGVLDPIRDHWIGTSFYWSGQSGYRNGEMAVPFTLANPTHVRLILANFAPHPTRSVWGLQTVRVVRSYLTGCAISTLTAWYPNPPTSVSGALKGG